MKNLVSSNLNPIECDGSSLYSISAIGNDFFKNLYSFSTAGGLSSISSSIFVKN